MTVPASTPPAGPGVRRLNRVPIVLVALVGGTVALALVYSINRRAAATRASADPAAPAARPAHPVVDSSALAAELTRDQPVAGVIPADSSRDHASRPRPDAAPEQPPVSVPATTPAAPPTSAPADSARPRDPAWTDRKVTLAAPGPRPPSGPESDASAHLRTSQQRRAQVYEAALAAPTRVNFATPSLADAAGGGASLAALSALAANGRPDPTAAALQAAALRAASASGPAAADPNLQDTKTAFLEKTRAETYLPTTRLQPISPYELKMGTVIPAVMISGINSDLPGQLIAQVSQHVYDTGVGRHLLIPQGAKLYGHYDSRVAYGQDRVLVVWTRLTFPDASSLDLGGMAGADQAGYGGFADQVDNHYRRIFGGALLLSAISAGVQVSQPDGQPGTQPTAAQTASGAVGQELGRVGTALVEKNIAIQPTLKIRPGYRFNVIVSKDVAFTAPYSPGR